jgi:hypothetical protein
MMKHKFQIGQIVRFSPNTSHAPNAGVSYEIVRLLPSETLDLQYRIRKSTDGQERIVSESELS